MKNLKLVGLTALAMMVLAFANVNAQNETVLIRTTESFNKSVLESSMIVTASIGESTVVSLKNGYEGVSKNNDMIIKEIQKWKNEGYKLISVSTGGEYVITNIYILEK